MPKPKRETGRDGFQADLIEELREMFPDAIILKNDANYLQGVPDVLVLHEDRWAALECKASADAIKQPNQGYYVGLMNAMSYASFVYPENRTEVLHDLCQTFGRRRPARVSQR